MSLSNWKGDALSLLAGVLMPFAFAPFQWWPVLLVALFLFLLTIRDVSPRRAAVRGYLFGLGYFGLGVSWVYVSIHLFGNATTPLAATITILFILILSGYTALTAWVSNKLSATHIFKWMWVFPAAWVLIEWLRGWLFTGFGWLQLGYAFTDAPLAEYGPFVGVLGISLLVVLTVAAIFPIFSNGVHIAKRALVVVIVIAIWLPPVLMDFPELTERYGQSQKVAIMQGSIPQRVKWHRSQRQPTLDLYRSMTEQHWDKDIIVWPEMAIPAFEKDVSGYLETMHYAAQLSSTVLITGLPVGDREGEYYNSLTVLGNASRDEESTYLKRHLVPFGEYLPLKFLLDPILGYLEIPMSNFSVGRQDKPLVAVGEHKAGAFICYEIAFASDVAEAFPEADYLVNISNDAWFGGSLAPYQHLQIARMRAIETGRYIMRATNTGISAIIGSNGKVQDLLRQDERGVLEGQIHLVKGQTVYSRVGNYPVIVLILMLLIILWYRQQKH